MRTLSLETKPTGKTEEKEYCYYCTKCENYGFLIQKKTPNNKCEICRGEREWIEMN
jgi:hypothetical protein